ncbi:MFS transporter [Pseudactinotalea sp.]|uniref:MFS transporter n=1 Tax=Pseudactinotalea sp. TaxID=1926260 RepID=UPI003B3A2AB0
MSLHSDDVAAPVVADVPPVRAGARAWAALAVLMLPVLLVSVDNTVLGLALPAIASDLHPSATEQLWMMDIYPLVLAALLLVMGSVADRIGRRRMLLLGATGFAAVSAAAAFAPSAAWLIAARGGMGIFGAMLMPATLALLRSLFLDDAQRRLAIAVWTATFSAGAALGPLLGGILLSAFGWGSVFLMAVPVLVPLLGLALWLIPESKNPSPGRVDALSVVLSVLAMGPVVLAIKEVAVHGLGLLPLTMAVAGVVAGIVFVRRQRALAARPDRGAMLDVGLFRIPGFRYSVLVNLISMTAMVGFLFVASQHLQLVLQLSPLQAAVVLLPGGVVAMGAGFAAVRLVRRFTARSAISVALLVSAVGYGVVAFIGADVPAAALGAGFVLLGIGVGVAETLSHDLIIASAPPARAGAASAVSETAYEVGAVLGTAVLGGLVTMLYRSHLVLPTSLSREASEAAGGSLAGALDEADQLPIALGETLAEGARAAFESGVGITTGVGALLMVAAALVAWGGLRPRGR